MEYGFEYTYPVVWKLAEYYDKSSFQHGFLSAQDMSEVSTFGINVLV